MRSTVIVVALWAASSAALADQGGDAASVEARQHFDAGAKAYAIGDYSRAIEEYKASLELSPSSARPLLLFDLGQAYRAGGNYSMALHSYQQYLALAPHGHYRADAEDQVKTLKPLVEAQQRATAAPPDGVVGPEATPMEKTPSSPAPTAPVAAPPRLAPSSEPPPAAARPSAEVVSRPWYKSGAGWGLCGSGLATLAVGAGLLGAAPGLDNQAAKALSLQSHDDLSGRAGNFRIAGFTLVAVGGAAIVAGGITLIVASSHHRTMGVADARSAQRKWQ